MTDTFQSTFVAERIPACVVERAEVVALELATHAGVRPVVMGHFAMDLAAEWHDKKTPLDGDGAPIVLVPRLSRWLVLKLGEADPIFVYSGRERGAASARALEQQVAFFAIGPAGRVTDRMAASREFGAEDFDSDEVGGDGPAGASEVAAAEVEPEPVEIRIEKQGRRYVVLVGDVVVATASSKQRALNKADVLRRDPDVVAPATAAA